MKEEIRRNIIIIALSNLIEDYSNSLESDLNNQERELVENILSEAKEMLSEYSQPPHIKRPQWKKT